MSFKKFSLRCLFPGLLLCSCLAEHASAQVGGQVGGIMIDGTGVVQTTPVKKLSVAAMKRMQEEYARTKLPAGLVVQSSARVLSLKQLNTATLSALDANEEFPAPLKYLAGLQRIDSLILDREQQDILLVGSAEGFGPGPHGQMLGVTTGRPPLQLDDLVIALRAIFSGQREIGVSIDPTEENMSNLQNYIRRNSNATTTAAAQQRYQVMGSVLGNQVITFGGVPDDSHFAMVLAEADLRMKRISLGLDPSGVAGVRSQLSLLAPQGNSLQRWWFIPDYETIGTNAERTLFEFRGQRAQLLAQEEIAGADGKRYDAAMTRRSTQKFAELFTKHFEELADKNPAFAELQGLYDLTLVATLIREHWTGTARQNLDVLLQEPRLPLQSYPVPKLVKSASTYRKSSRGMLIGLIGGVTIEMGRISNAVETRQELNLQKHQMRSTPGELWWNPSGDAKTPQSRNE